MLGPLPEDIYAQEMFVNGSAMLSMAITDYWTRRATGKPLRSITPGALLWRRAGGEHGLPVARYPEAQARSFARDQLAESLRTRRDPCPRCGVRADIGCKHNPQSIVARQTPSTQEAI